MENKKEIKLPAKNDINKTKVEIEEQLKLLSQQQSEILQNLAASDGTYRDITGRIRTLEWLLETEEKESES